jgi:hypothetical protein
MTSFVVDLTPEMVAKLKQSKLVIGVPTVPLSVQFEPVEAPDGSFVTTGTVEVPLEDDDTEEDLEQ